MFAKMRSPLALAGSELDSYLARGWFRMRQNIFTTSFLQFHNKFYSVIWLRIALKELPQSKKQRDLYKINARFKTEIKHFDLKECHESLYQAYRKSISFDVSSSLQELLVGNETYNRYDTYQVTVYDNDELIALGFFDLGKESAAGIACIYHPDYKKHSLGKYLMFLKIDFCRNRNIRYFYPGYLVPGYKAFDYKTSIGKEKLEYFNLGLKQWLPYHELPPELTPLQCMQLKLGELKKFLEDNGISSAILYYKFFDVNLDPGFYGNGLFDFPIFLYCFPTMGSFDYHVIVYDVRDLKFHFLLCSSFILIDYNGSPENIFSSGLLKVDKHLAITEKYKDLTDFIINYL